VCTDSPAHRGDGKITSKKFKGLLKSPLSDEANIALNIYSSGTTDSARGFHFTKRNVFTIRNDSARRSLAALLLIDKDDTVLFPFGNGMSGTDNGTNWVTTVIT